MQSKKWLTILPYKQIINICVYVIILTKPKDSELFLMKLSNVFSAHIFESLVLNLKKTKQTKKDKWNNSVIKLYKPKARLDMCIISLSS